MINLRLQESWPACVVLILGAAFYIAFDRSWVWWNHTDNNTRSPQNMNHISDGSKTAKPEFSEANYYCIDGLNDLNLENEEPIKIRPFKARYHLTMAIENIPTNDLILMDKTYTSRIALRHHLIQTHHDEVLAWTPTITPAVSELYTWLTSTYLPQRFPTIYTLQESSLLNHITNRPLPLTPPPTEEALQILGTNIDTDILFLLPIPNGEADAGKYRLEGFITCFPSGFSTREKLGLKLADIHGPVPGYAAKLEKSMDRFFAGLPVGKIVKRVNWSITTDDRLFATAGNHMAESEFVQDAEVGGQEKERVDLRQAVLRCERQTLHRLPRTGALVFAFKTYQYPVQDLRDEECREELAQAIDGLGEGSVPGIRVYKRQVVWGDKVKRFLRGEIGVDD